MTDKENINPEENENKSEASVNEEATAQEPVAEEKNAERVSEVASVDDDGKDSTSVDEADEDDLTGIEEASEQEIVQKVTKKNNRNNNKKKKDRFQDRGKETSEWIEKVIQIRRVTKVVKGGKKLSFRAVVIVGNGKNQVGVGVGKASEVVGAIQKGISDAKKSLITTKLIGSTIPHQIIGIEGAANVLLKPAREGTGIIAGGAARTVLELSGVGDILSKSLGSRSPLNVARATIHGLKNIRKFEEVAKLRNMSVKEMLVGS